MCELILSYFIVGAMEVSPGTMKVDYMTRVEDQGAVVETVYMPLNRYLSCWGNQYD